MGACYRQQQEMDEQQQYEQFLINEEMKMRKYINEHGKVCWDGINESTPITRGLFHDVGLRSDVGDSQWAFHSNLGSITVLDRLTGFGWRDVETGYRDKDGKFWLASGGFDIRDFEGIGAGEAIKKIKDYANNVIGE